MLLALLLMLLLLSRQAGAEETPALPGFEQLEQEGAIIGDILIDNQDIFDLSNPKEDNFLFRFANWFHIRTRPSVIRRELLFKSGDPVSVQVIEETERLLRSNGFLYDVMIRPVAYTDGIVDIEVVTRDAWSLETGLGFSRKGGENKTSTGLKEYNLFGTGVRFGFDQKTTSDGTVTNWEFRHPQLLGTRAEFAYEYENRYDGFAHNVSLVRPFYSLDSRWTAGTTATKAEYEVSGYTDGVLTSQYLRDRNAASVFGGWSRGLVDGWTRRYTVGVDYDRNDYTLVPDQPPPDSLPEETTRVAPFIQYQVIEDNFAKLKNRDQIERAEYFGLGFQTAVKLGYAASALGSTHPAWIYSGAISNGVELSRERIFVASGSVTGLYSDGYDQDYHYSGTLKYYVPQSEHVLTFGSITGDIAHDDDASNLLTIGGDTGLSGYPKGYQSGDHRVLFNIEQRYYTDWYPLRLFRVGGAIFADVGRAWAGTSENAHNPGWLSDIGVGLRIFSVRSAFGTVWHVDFAFPLNSDENIPSYQFQVVSKTSF